MKAIRYVLLLIIGLNCCLGVCNTLREVQQADSALSRRDNRKAIELYESIIDKEGESVALYTNLATAYHAEGENGKAMIALLKARKIDPSDTKVNNNLKYLRNSVVGSNKGELKGKRGNLNPEEPSFFRQIYNLIAIDHLSNTWAVWGALCFLLMIGCVVCYCFVHNVIIRKVGFFGWFITGAGMIVFMIFALYSAREASNKQTAVIISAKAQIYKTPSQDAEPVTVPLHSGTELIVLPDDNSSSEEWVNIKLNNNFSGWIRKSDIEII